MSPRTRFTKGGLLVVPLCLALGAAGCSMDEVQFNGGLFDAVGLSDSAQQKSGDPKIAERAPLVVPPTLDRLPPPGEAAPQDSQIATIKDPDAEAKRTQAELEKAQQEYCDKHYREHDASTTSVEGPLGPCRKSILTSIKKWNAEE
jgi:hypothetical protein